MHLFIFFSNQDGATRPKSKRMRKASKKCLTHKDWSWEHHTKDMELNRVPREEERAKYEAALTHDDWLELVAEWESNVESEKTWWSNEFFKNEMERTKELRSTAHRAQEARERELDAAGDVQECIRCGATVDCGAGETTEDVSYLSCSKYSGYLLFSTYVWFHVHSHN